MLDRLDDTIVAISSAPGHAPLGIVRLTGPEALSIAEGMARTDAATPLSATRGSTRAEGEVRPDADVCLPAYFYVFRNPHSYTREDVVEIYSVGSPAALELIRRRALELGAAPAEPGEFTARAFLNGAMDLAEAEAVAQLIRAQSDTQLRASRRMLEGALSRRVAEVRTILAELVALVEADIDFAEEPIEFITPPELRDRLSEVGGRLALMLTEAPPAERFEVLPRILLFGPPNAGKSSLMNRLSGVSRAICAAAAGTTRDVLCAPIQVGRGEAMLLDSAGVDRSVDEVAGAARNLTLAEAERVDLVCLVVDVAEPLDEHVLGQISVRDTAPTVIAANKCDLITGQQACATMSRLREWRLGAVCLVSASQGTGLEELRDALSSALSSSPSTTTLGEAVVLTRRQQTATANAHEAVQRAVALSDGATETIDCADVLAFELREALNALGAVVGEVTTDDLLSEVFSSFCIGK